MRLVLAVLVLVSLSAAACAGQLSHLVPAVIGDGGGLVNITMRMEPGTGSIYSTIYPRIGIATQDSIDNALGYAFFLAGEERGGCDVYVSIDTPSTEGYVEGPSAGMVISVLAYAVLENGTIRDDTVVTGGIDERGRIFAVGGLYEKARAAAAGGASYFLCPVPSFHDIFLLRNVENDYGVRMLYASEIGEAVDFLLYDKSIEPFDISSAIRDMPEIEEYPGKTVEGFDMVAERMIELEEHSLSGLVSEDGEISSIQDYFENEIDIGRYVAEKKYHFTAANNAFLNYIEIETIKKIQSGDVDISEKKKEIEKCLEDIERPVMGEDNFEWVVGSDLRRTWARYRMSQIDAEDYSLMDEKYFAYNQLMYADAWCFVSGALAEQGTESAGGVAFDESVWEPLASEKIELAASLPDMDEDLADKLEMALKSYEDGRYGAAVYDASYVAAFVVADSDIRELESEELEGEVDSLLDVGRESLWARVYKSQASYLAGQGDYENAYRLLLLSKSLDESTDEMRSAIPEQESVESPDFKEVLVSCAILLIFIIFLVLFSYTIIVWCSHGNNNKRPGKGHGTAKEKGKTRAEKGVPENRRGKRARKS